jgi:hypothetical protein
MQVRASMVSGVASTVRGAFGCCPLGCLQQALSLNSIPARRRLVRIVDVAEMRGRKTGAWGICCVDGGACRWVFLPGRSTFESCNLLSLARVTIPSLRGGLILGWR